MRGRFFAVIILSAGCLALQACSTVRHDNVMLFGTDTNFGITAGASATNVAQVNVGYRRQEAVVLPLVANKAMQDGKTLVPCEISGSDPAPSECKLVAQYGGQSRDSYSVLASFGAKFGAKSASGAPEASGGLAQYFATGVAAQVLALKGGAALVSTGEAAAASAETDVQGSLSTLVNSPAAISASTSVHRRWNTRRVELTTKLLALSDAELDAYIPKLSGAAYLKDGKPYTDRISNLCEDAKLDPLRKCIENVQAGFLTGQDIDDLFEADASLSKAADNKAGGQ